jgi:hypothetical protein
MYRTEGGAAFSKVKLAWVTADGVTEAVEILGKGQQYVVVGEHGSGATIKWRGDVGFDQLTPITAAKVETFIAAVVELITQRHGPEALARGRAHAARSTSEERLPIPHPEHVTPGPLSDLADALRMIPNDCDYDEWIKRLAAIKAGFGGSEEFYEAVVDWSMQWGDNTPEVIREKWDSFHDSELGHRWVFGLARQHGYVGGFYDFDGLLDDVVEDCSPFVRPVIRLRPNEKHETLSAIDAALVAPCLGFYQRGKLIVKPVIKEAQGFDQAKITVPRLDPVDNADALVAQLDRAAVFLKHNERKKGWVAASCPKDIANAYLHSPSEWQHLPTLKAIVHTPLVRLAAEATILDQPGYDPETQLLFAPLGTRFKPIPRTVSRDEAVAAVEHVVTRLLTGFPFVSKADRAVALAAMLTSILRPLLPTAPMFAFSAPTAGSGKSFLVDLCVALATGRNAAVIAAGKTEEEMEKRLGACLIQGAAIAIDNVEHPLGGDMLCQMLTQGEVKVRILGLSKTAEMPTSVMVFCTGNNLVLQGDMTRRALVCTLDPGVERPELRPFDSNPLEIVKAERGDLVVDLLTAVVAYAQVGAPQQATPLASFEAWSHWVRDLVIWLGYDDPCAVMEETRANDPKLSALRAVLENWAILLGDRRVTANEVVAAVPDMRGFDDDEADDKKEARAALREALFEIAGEGRSINMKRLGRWLGANKGRVVAGRKLLRLGKSVGIFRWQVVEG